LGLALRGNARLTYLSFFGFATQHSRIRRLLVIIGIEGGAFFLEESGCANVRGNGLERNGRLRHVEAVGKIVGVGVGVAEGVEAVGGFDVVEDAAEVVPGVGDLLGLGVGRDHDQGHAEAVDIAGVPADAVVDDFRSDVIIPAAPIVPSNDDGSVGPIRTVADRIDDGGDKRPDT